MRMLHVLESLAAGGIETTFLNVLREFRAADPSVQHDVLALAGGPLESRYRQTAESVTIACDTPTITRVLQCEHDVIYVLFERCTYRLLPLLLGHSTTPVVYGKGYDLGGMYRLNEGFDWSADEAMLAAADAATFTTAELAAGYPMPAGRTTVLRKAADVAAFTGLPQADAATPRRIVCVANLHPRKRLGDLILALREVRHTVPDAELRLVGGGNPLERQRLEQLARQLGVAEGVSFAGLVANVANELRQSRVIALPSSCEGVSTALLEGMAAGRPVVATNVGHISSVIDDGVEGFLCPVGDVDALAARLALLLANPGSAAMMGAAARRRAAAHDVGAVARQLLVTLKQAA
jgi:glycosyltransferase involved in cell wall biosynthesis